MSTFSNIATRGWSVIGRRDLVDSDSTLNMMIAFLGIVFFSLCLVSLLVMLRRIKMQRLRSLEDGLPKYKEFEDEQPQGRNINRLNIHTADGRSSVMIVNGRPMLSDPNSPPDSPNNVPEIHITFPDEHDAQGRQQNGRVVVVRVGETSIGLEPYKEEQLPAYQKENANGFYSIDMNQIGGLKEKDSSRFQ